jgi:hypothetical protein
MAVVIPNPRRLSLARAQRDEINHQVIAAALPSLPDNGDLDRYTAQSRSGPATTPSPPPTQLSDDPRDALTKIRQARVRTKLIRVGLLQAANPQSLNGYDYADNDPVSHSDPSGLAASCSGLSGQSAINCNAYASGYDVNGMGYDHDPSSGWRRARPAATALVARSRSRRPRTARTAA